MLLTLLLNTKEDKDGQKEKQSALIESFLLNIPVPPIFSQRR